MRVVLLKTSGLSPDTPLGRRPCRFLEIQTVSRYQMNDSQRGAELNPARGIVQRTGRLRRAVLVSVVVAVACIAQGMPSPAATGTPSAPSLVVASQPGPAPELTVSWDPGAGPAP